jgi:hypothetical protein
MISDFFECSGKSKVEDRSCGVPTYEVYEGL